MVKRAAIYRRVSGPDDPRQVSLDDQKAKCLALAKSRGFLVEEEDIFTENFSGAEFYDRPVYKQIRAALKQRKYQAVITFSLDRLSRKQAHQAHMIGEMEEHGCEYLSVTEDLDNSPEGALMRSIRGYVAEVERIKIIDRTQGAKKRIRAEGKIIPQGKARLGYRYATETRSRVIVEEEAAVVRRMFALAADGASAMSIAQVFNAEGVPTPSEFKGRKRVKLPGKPVWRHDTVAEILRDPSYYGEPMVQGKSKLVGGVQATGRRAQVAASPDEFVPTTAPTPVIVPRDLWVRANAKGRKGDNTRNKKHPRLLRGLGECGVCGRPTTSSYGKYGGKRPTVVYYACQSKYTRYRRSEEKQPCGNKLTPAEWADEYVWSIVRRMAQDPGAKDRVIESQRQHFKVRDLSGDLAFHVGEVKKSERAIARLMEEFESEEDEVMLKALRQRKTILASEVKSHREAIADLEARIAETPTWESFREQLDRTWDLLRAETSRDPTFEEKRKVLEWLQLRVVFRGKELVLKLGVKVEGSNNSNRGIDKRVDLELRHPDFRVALRA